MSLLNTKVTVKPKVEEGNYETILTNIEEIENSNGGYIKLSFDNGIEYVIFGQNAKQQEYVIKTMARQLDKDGELTLGDVLIKDHSYKMYVTYNEYGQNVAFGVKTINSNEDEDLAL